MSIDENATQYEEGNGRFDLMTDEQVRSLSGDELQSVLVRLAHLLGEENDEGAEIYHKLYELHLRYPGRDFRFEVLP